MREKRTGGRRIPLYRRKGIAGYALVDEADYPLVVGRRWHLATNGYPSSSLRLPDGRKTVARMHRVLLGLAHGDRTVEIDHRNGNKLDNRRVNLRPVSHPGNMANRSRLNSNNTSGYRGVVYDKARRKWKAQVKLHGRNRVIGRFASPEAANEAAVAFRREHMPTSEADRSSATEGAMDR